MLSAPEDRLGGSEAVWHVGHRDRHLRLSPCPVESPDVAL